MGLKDSLERSYIDALKQKNERVVSVMRMLKTAIKNNEIEVQHALADEEIHAIIRRLIKQAHEALADFERGGRADLAEQAREEMEILKAYVPASMTEEEISSLVDAAIAEMHAQTSSDAGKVMGAVMKKAGGRADGNAVRAAVMKMLA